MMGLGTAVFWNQPIYKKYRIDGKGKIGGLKIVFLSDLHNTMYGKNQSKLIAMIDQVAPDLILMGGDMVDERSYWGPTKVLLSKLKDRYPMVYITGNHEYWVEDPEEVHTHFKSCGAQLLLNETCQIETPHGSISVVGLADPDCDLFNTDKQTLIKALAETYDATKMTGYKILLSHRPEHINVYRQYGVDLVISGHAHGGQGRIPFILNGLYAPNQGFFPKYAGGYYLFNEGLEFIIGRGLSYKKKLPRVMNPPEVVVIEFD